MNNTINLIFANASATLKPNLATIEIAANKAIAVCTELLSSSSVDIIVLDDKNNVIPEIGVGGYTPNRHLLYLYVDSTHVISVDEIYNTICHELHHAKRYDGPGYGNSLFDSMVFEGLACCFEQEVQNKESYFLHAITQYGDAYKLIADNRDYFESKEFNYREWFITGNKNLPRWAGYIMGYTIAKEYLKKTNKKASELVLEDPKLVYKVCCASDKGRASSIASDEDALARNV